MTNFNEPTNVADLIGLWDFLSGNETADTGLDDGIAQNGNAVDGNGVAPSFSNDQLVVGAGSNSNPTIFDVNANPNSSADDEQFNLDRGTIEVQFTQSSQSGGSEDVILSRGEMEIDEADEGYFEIRVTDDGRVQSYHNTDCYDHEATLSTSSGFFSPGDVINVKYSFDEATGARLTVENITTGETESYVTTETGLTFDLTDNDDEEFTFGAREKNDAEYDKEFQGTIDYVALYTTTNNPITDPSGPDYIVEGTSAGELIDAGYTGDPEGDMIDALDNNETPANNDDLVRAGAGNDTVYAGDGDDTVHGGSGNDFIMGDDDNSQDGNDVLLGEDGDDTLCGLDGNDTLDGGAGEDLLEGQAGDDLLLGGSGADRAYGGSGDDTIFGDSGTQDDGSVREVFQWDLAPSTGAPDFSQNTGNVTVSFSEVNGGASDNISTDTQNVSGIDNTTLGAVDATSSLDSETGGEGNSDTYALGFSDPVENVSFRVNDIDGDGVVRIQAFDAGGNPIEVQLAGGSNLTLLDTDGVAGVDTADSNGGYLPDTSDEYSLLVTIPGPVSEIKIFHTQDGSGNSGVNVTDVYFDVPGVNASEGAGDDTLDGGTGDDLIYGEGGDDSITGGSGNDTIEGGDGADDMSGGNDRDMFIGGNNGDVVDGGTGSTAAGDVDDVDTLDLTGEGPFRIINETVDADGNSTSGTIEFLNGDGTPNGDTLDFTEIEVILGDEVNQDPEADNDSGSGDEDNDITGNVLDNDSDPDGDALTVIDNTDPSNGTLVIGADGEYTYTPDQDFFGDDSFTYTVSDGNGGEDTATVFLTVNPVNDDPDAMDDNSSTPFETGVEINVLANDTDVDNPPSDLTVTSISVPPAQGTLTPTGTEGVYTFTPAAGFEGTATVSYTISDGAGGSDSASHTVEVGADPTPQDGIVDGEESGELMELGYDDSNLPTDQGGDIITNDADEIEGNGGNDTIDGEGGDDTIDGGDGDDVIEGNDGTNVLSGGSGDDTFIGGDGADSFEGNEGQDNLDYSGSGAAVNVDLSTGALSGGDADNDSIVGGIDGVIGSEFDDVLTGFDQSGSDPADTFTNELFGEGGDDTISGKGGDDLLDGGDDDDLVDGGDGDDTVLGGDGSDSLSGGEGDDSLVGGGDDDDITVGAGDTAEGGSGDDEFYVDPTLAGDNTITVIGGETGEDFTDPTNGGEGDTLDLRGLDLVSLVYDPTDPEAGTAVYNNDAGDPVTLNFSEIEIVLHDPLPDGAVDGEEFAEDMGPGYDDGNLPTDGGGDLIDGADGLDDTIFGNGGDDTINAGLGSDTVSGGTGDDSIFGGATDDADVIDGDEGDDTLQGGGGDDTIDGGADDDVIEGGTGNDDITGGDGNDSVDGGSGNDVIDTSGSDPATDLATPDIPPFITGAPGDVDPNNDKDTVNGGEGNDSITTGDDADLISGGIGEDTIDGGIDADTIDGGADDDSIVGGEGSDSILGGGGADTIYGGLDPSFPDVLNVADDGFNSPIGPDPVPDNGDDFIDGGAGNDLIFGQDDDDTILGGTGNDTIDGGVDNDSILGGQGEDSIEGGHGQDFIQGNNDNDSISGGRGSDTLEGNAGDDTIIGGAGDSIIGGGGADSIFIDQDEVDENGDNDEAIFVEGNTFGDDNDTLDLTDFLAYRNLVETLDGDGDSTSGTVQVQNDELEWVTVTFGEIEDLILPDKAPDGIVDGEEFGEVMELGYDDANLPTDGGGDLITDGDDSIEGNGGDDSIQAAGGDDSVDGGTGDDTIRGNGGNDSLIGGEGEDSISGGTGDDTIDGGDDDDTITGGSGDDVIDGGEGNDTITGSTGNDSITDMEGDNEINSDNPGSFNPDLGTPVGSPGGGFIVAAPDADPNDNKDTITTGDGNDTINAGDDADVINAGDGNNVIDGGTDADTITSGSGNDSIVGGEGSDSIDSGDGDDTIDGGVGSPLVNFIDEPNPGFFGDPILDNGDDTINAGAGNDVVNGEDDNDLIDGGTGNDTLDGGIDDDTVLGGEGNDVIVGGQGADSLDGGLGNDTFNVGTFTDPNGTGDYQEGVGDTVVGGEDPGDVDEDTLDLTGGGSLKVVFDDAVDPLGTPGESGTVIYYTDDTQTVESGRLTFKEIENVIPCFTPGAMIATPRGEVPVETLREGDKVITRDNGIQEIRWTGSRTLNREELAEGNNLKPILVKAGSLGRNLPERDMLVSPQHRVLITGETPQLYFEESEVLVAAKHLVGKQGVSIMDTMRTTYIHFMFDRHEVVLSDGAWTESFQPGDQTLGAMGEASRDEIFALFPELLTEGGLTDYAAARRSLKAHEAKLLQL